MQYIYQKSRGSIKKLIDKSSLIIINSVESNHCQNSIQARIKARNVQPTHYIQPSNQLVAANFSMPEVLHPNPSYNNPYPRHNTRENDQRRVVSHNW